MNEVKEPEKVEEKVEIKPKEETIVTKKEEYKRNDDMINKIKQMIQNNESEMMKKYGYTIEVDSSIKGKTNQFTFTEKNVRGYLSSKFGTIRIYAESHYVDGELIMVECYII